MELIRLKEVEKAFGQHRILEGINLSIEEGDRLGIIGESGCGKTTLLNLITGFMEPSEGEVLYFSSPSRESLNLSKNLRRFKKLVGFTPQYHSFYPKLTVKENLLHFGKLYGVEKSILFNNIKSLLHFTQLFEHRDKLAEELSGGMQKRLNISCSLLHKPRILVLDEPTADLDPILQNEVLFLLREVNQQGVTIVIASHHMESIESLCSKVVILHKGHIHSWGTLEEVSQPFLKDHFTISLRPGKDKELILRHLQSLPIKKIIEEGNKLVIYPAEMEKTFKGLMSYIREENLYLHDLDLRKPSLQEIFEKIVREE